MGIVPANWTSVTPKRWPAWLRGMVVPLSMGLGTIVLGAPSWVLVFFLWTYPVAGLGYRVLSVPMEVARQPFSFCLPGYRQSLRRSCLLAALCAGVGFAPVGLIFLWILALRDRNPTAAGICLHGINGSLIGAAGLMCIGLDLRFIVSSMTWGFIRLLSIPCFFAAVIAFPALMEYPIFGIPPAVVVCAVVWVCLGDMSRVARGHRAILEDALERRAQIGNTETVSPWIDGLFRGLMERRRWLSSAGYIWGSLYRAFGLAFSYWIWMLLSIIGAALGLGYAPGWFARMMLVSSGSAALAVHLPIAFDGVLLPLGRRERRYATLAVAIAVSLLFVGGAGLVIACTWILLTFLPSLWGSPYASLGPRDIYLPCLLVPWLLGWRLLGYRRPRLAGLIASATMVFAIVAIYLLGKPDANWPGAAEPILLVALAAGGWPFFLLALHDASRGAFWPESDSGAAGTD